MSKNKRTAEIARLERNLVTAARVVDLYGEKYIALFKRIDSELERARGDADILARARRLAA